MSNNSKAPSHAHESDKDTRKLGIIEWVKAHAKGAGGDGQSSAAEFPGTAKGLFGTAGPKNDDPASSADASADGGIGLVGISDHTPDNAGGDFF